MLVFIDNLQLFDNIDTNKFIDKDISILGKLEINIKGYPYFTAEEIHYKY